MNLSFTGDTAGLRRFDSGLNYQRMPCGRWGATIVPFLLCGFLILFACHRASAQNSDPKQLFKDAVEAQKRGDGALAVREYQEVVRLRPDLIAARVGLAGALISLGRLDEAVEQYRAALKEVPGNAALSFSLGLVYLKKGEVEQAAGLFSSLHEAHPDNARIAGLLGACDLRLHRNRDAVSLLRPLEKANSTNLYLEWVLGSALVRTGRVYEGVARLENVAQQTHSPRMYMAAAEANLKIRRFRRARQDFDAAEQLNPHLAGLDTLDGVIMESEGDIKGAVAAFQKVLAADPNDFQAELHLGTILYTERQLNAAQTHLQHALEINPASAAARYQLARVEQAQGELEAAVKNLEEVEQGDPSWLPPHLELSALYYRMNRPQDGERERKTVDRLRTKQQQNSGITGPSPSP
ncbi:MAG: tetratricopeptide repeat protein [Terriglobia bacterium]